MPTRRKDMERAVWATTHRDYRGVTDGVKHILYLDPKTGGTVSAPLSSVPEEILADKYRSSLKIQHGKLGRLPTKTESKVTSSLNKVLSVEVPAKFWEPSDLVWYLTSLLEDSGYVLAAPLRKPSVGGGESSTRMSFPGSTSTLWLILRYGVSPGHERTGRIWATASVGRS